MFKQSKEPEKKGSEKREDLLVSFLKDAHFVFAIISRTIEKISNKEQKKSGALPPKWWQSNAKDIRTDIIEMIVILLKCDFGCKDSDNSTICLVNIGHFLLCAPAMPFCKVPERICEDFWDFSLILSSF